MSKDELIGTFGNQYVQAKEQLTSLQAEAHHYAEQFRKLADMLEKPSHIDLARNMTWQLSFSPAYPSKEALEQLVTDIARLTNEVEHARQELKKLGLPVV